MKMSDAFPSTYLKAADLQKKTITVRIRAVEMEDIGGDHKPVLYFHGKDKGLVLNKTNGTTIAYRFGDEMDAWEGAEIELYPTMTSFQGRQVEAIRVNAMPPPAGRQSYGAPLTPPAPPPGQQYDERNPPPITNNDIPF